MVQAAILNDFKQQRVDVNDRSGEYRSFKVLNQDFVSLPNCLSVEAVRLDGRVMPQYAHEHVLTDLTMKHFQAVDVALWGLVDGPETPILVRGTKSNDGNWQLGSIVSVRGTWADDEAVEPIRRGPGRPPKDN